MNQLLAMRLFARVVEMRSLTKAATSLKVPKGTATKLLQRLEKHLRLTLVQRTTRRVAITPAGEGYYERISAWLNELDEIESAVARSHTGVHGTLRVDAPASFSQIILVPNLPAFLSLHPDLRLNLGVSDRPFDLVAEGVDCVIRCGPLFDQSLMARRVGVLETVLCAAPAYIKEHGTPLHPRELDSKHLVVHYANPHTGRVAAVMYSRRLERAMVFGRNVVTINESTTHMSAGLSGVGIVLTFEFLARSHLARGELIPLLPEWRVEATPVYVVYAPTRHPSARLRAFIDWVASICSAVL